jgi:hypothetical protein
MVNDLFTHLSTDTGSVGLNSLALHVAGVPSIFAILSTSVVRREATFPTIHQTATTTTLTE